jgi:thioesterase domain-containing protein
LDGWSSQIILTEVLERYNARESGKEMNLPVLPTYEEYLAACRKTAEPAARQFWSEYLKGMRTNYLIDAKFQGHGTSVINKLTLSESYTSDLKKLAGELRITVNTLVQGAWAIVLSKLFATGDVAFGITVSGRAADLDNMHLLSGMFMNVHPFRTCLDKKTTISEWLRGIQKKQLEARKFEHLAAEELLSYSKWPAGQALFDTLMVFENYPSLKLASGALQVSDFTSGLTSTYPLTLTVIPASEMEFALSVKPDTLTEWHRTAVLTSLINILQLLSGKHLKNIEEIINLNIGLDPLPGLINKGPRKAWSNPPAPPRNKNELRLLKIWEFTFGKTGISIHDNYFEMGGKSLLAVSMFGRINREFQTRLLPTTILENPTIASLAGLLEARSDPESGTFRNLVPLRAQGTKPPLYCLHAGGGHVFFYKPLADLMDANRPVYAIQPSGIYSEEPMHPNIETMARAYVDQIISLNPGGPYNLLAYCFSTAVGLEMVRLFNKKGLQTNLIIMDSFVNQEAIKKTKLGMRVASFLKRLWKNPLNSVKIMFADRFNTYLKPRWYLAFGNDNQKNTTKVAMHLVKLYNMYDWPEYDGDITLVLTIKIDDSFNRETINSWKSIIKKNIRVVYTKGNHRTIFEHPDVIAAAETIEVCCL